MNSWTRVIIEWANCLGIVESTIESLDDLQDGIFYERLVSQLCRGNEETFHSSEKTKHDTQPVSKFIQAEYPEFGSVDRPAEISENLYTASLLLLQCSQQPMFHRPMCVTLKHETQIQIKRFLEMVLPYGKNLTRDSIGAAITELGDAALSETSLTPKIRPLREFFNSPAVKSARSQRFMNDRNRELMSLRAQLETEQFEKADLMEDLKMQNEKMSNLQKKLDEKTRELRELRIDRLKPPTPQSCRKTKRPSDNEERYRREAESLEEINSELMLDIEKLKEEREELSRRLTSNERSTLALKEKYEQSEKNIENLINQLETKNNELLDLRMNSEELREHIRQMKRLSIGEQSFDVEPICSEALSSIVDIQLQEARKESSQLKNELDGVRLKLENSLSECEKLRGLEMVLRDKETELDSVRSSLCDIEKQLLSSNERSQNLVRENSELAAKLEELEASLKENNELLILGEKLKNEMETSLKFQIQSLTKEIENVGNTLSLREENLSLVKGENENLKTTMKKITLELEDSRTSLENEKTLVKKLEATVLKCNAESQDLQNKLVSNGKEILVISEEKKQVETNLEFTSKKLETMEDRLNEERARVKDLELTLVKSNEDFNELEILFKTNERLLTNERMKIVELETTVRRGQKEYQDLLIMVEDLKVALKCEKEGSDELREIVVRSKKNSEELESLLRSSKLRIEDLENSLSDETSKCQKLESQVALTKKNCDDLRAELEAKEDLLRETDIRRANNEMELNTAKLKMEEIHKNLETVKTKLSEVEIEKQRSVSANEKLEEYARKADEKMIDVEIKISNYVQQIKDLDRSLLEKINQSDRLRNELDEKNNELDSLMNRISKMEKQETAMNESLKIRDKKIAELTELGEEMESQIVQQLENTKILRDENNTLNEKLSSYVRSTNDLTEKMALLQNELEETQETLQNEYSTSEELRKKINDSLSVNTELEKQLIDERNQFKTLSSEKESLDKQLASSISEISIMGQRIERIERVLEKSQENLQKESSICEDLRKTVQDLSATNNDLEKNLIKERNQFTSLSTEKDNLDKQLASLISEMSILKERIETMEQELKTSQENFQKESSISIELRKTVQDLSATNNELEQKLIDERSQFATLSTEKDNLDKQLASLISEMSIMKERIETMGQELKTSQENLQKESSISEDLRKTVQELSATNNELDKTLVDERNQFTTLSTEKDNLDKQLASLISEMSIMKERIETMGQELKTSQENLQKESSISEDLRTTVQDLSATNNDLEKKLIKERNQFTTISTEKDNLDKQLASTISEMSIMKKRVESMDQEFKTSQENLQKESSISEDLRKTVQDLSATNNDLEKKLMDERNQFTTLSTEKDNLDKQLASTIREMSIMKERIETMDQELKTSQENLQKESSISKELRKTLQELSATNNELDKKLIEKRNQFTTLSTEKDNLDKQLASLISEMSIMKERIESMDQELKTSQENLQKESSISIELRKTVQELSATNNELDKKLIDERNQFTTLSTEKDNLDKQLASFISETSTMKERIESTDQELKKSQENLKKELSTSDELRKQIDTLHATNSKLEEKIINEEEQLAGLLTDRDRLEKELAAFVEKTSIMGDKLESMKKELEVKENLDLELTQVREKLKELQFEKIHLEKELSSFANSKADMMEEISALHKELESSRNEQRNTRESNKKECEKLRQRIEELNEESKQRLKETNLLKNETEETKLEKERLTEKIEITTNTLASLEKRLVAAENAREELKLEDKLKEEALSVVRGKLEQLGKEKIESELRMKEVILNLQEVRTSQDQVMEAQVKVLEEKSCQLAIIEKELNHSKSLLVQKTRELETEQSKLKTVETEIQELCKKGEEQSILIKDLQNSLESERQRNRETTESYDSLNKKMEEIKRVSKILKMELNALWDSVRNACPELARISSKDENVDSRNDAEDIVTCFINDAKTIDKAISILGEANETLKEHLDSEKEASKIKFEEAEKEKLKLDERLTSMERELQKRDECLSFLAQRNKHLQGSLSRAISERESVEDELVHSMERWKLLNVEAQSFLTGSSGGEELEQLRIKRKEIEEILSSFNERHERSSKKLLQALCRIFLWSETKLQEACNVASFSVKEEFSPETLLFEEIQRDEIIRKDLTQVSERMNEFSNLLKTCEAKLKSGEIKYAISNEEKLQAQLEKIVKEKKELKDKLDAARVRNAKMEKNMDELRNTNKKLKTEISETITDDERAELERLRVLTGKLEEERTDLAKRIGDEKDIDARLEKVHAEYGQKLEKIKQKMKTAYNEQIAKLNQEQEKAIKEKMDALRIQTEQQCRKYTEDIAKYKAHISDLSSRYWDVGEKLLAETQEKQAAIQQLQRLKGQKQHNEAIAEIKEQVTHSRQKTASLDRREFSVDRQPRDGTGRPDYRAVEVIEEETTTFSTRRHSVKSIQAMGNAFDAEDEEGEVFDSVFLADLKEGRCAPIAPDYARLSELRMRNSLCRPHLKSSYAVETHLQPVALNEDDLKNGVTGDDVFNDSLSQSLLPGQKPKKKDRTQTSYKRPGPPTPSKNGGRLSLQGNELRSPNSRILKERNVDRRTTATPRGLKNLFGTSMSKRQDENTVGTPKGRRLSNIFRKQRTERN